MLTVVATDGFDVQPRVYQSVVINPGERYDFIIKADQTDGSYWIRADGMDVCLALYSYFYIFDTKYYYYYY